MKKSFKTVKTKINNANLVIISALTIVLVNGIALLLCNKYNKNKEAQRYYQHFEPIKFYVMEFCYTMLILSVTFNARFLIGKLGKVLITLKTLNPKVILNGFMKN